MLNGGPIVELKTAQTAQTQDRFDLTIGGNTIGAGGALISSGTLTLAAGNNVTLSQDGGNAITIIGGAGSAGAFSAGVSGLSNDSGTLGTVSNLLVIAGGNNITLSQSINAGSATITIIGGAGGAGTTFSAGVSNLSNDSGSTGTVTNQIVFAGGNNITLSQSSNVGGYATVTVIGPNTVAQSSEPRVISINGSTGVIVLTAGNNITLSENLSTITISAFNQSVQPAVGQLNGSSGTMSLVAGNNITLSENLSTITISGPNTVAQSVQPAVAEINGTSGTFSIVQGNLISLSNNLGTITISNILSSSGIAVDVSGASSQGSLSARFAMADHAHRGVAVVYASGANGANSYYGPMTIATGNANITLSTGASALSIHGPTPGAGVAIADSVTTVSSGTVNFVLSNNVQFGITSNSMTASAYIPAIGVSTGGNTCNTTGMLNSGSIVLQGGNNITLCMTTVTNFINTIEIIGAGGAILSYFENFGGIDLQPFVPAAQTGGGSNMFMSYQRIYVPANIIADELDMIYAMSGDSNSSGAFSFTGGLYSVRLSSSSSTASGAPNFRTTSFSSTVNATLLRSFTGNVSWTSGNTSTGFPQQYAAMSGTQYFVMGLSYSVGTAFQVTITQGDYLFGFMLSTNMPAATLSIYGLSSLNIDSAYQQFANNSFFHKGYISTTSALMPAFISLSQITQNGSSVLAQPYFFMAQGQTSASTTGTF